MSLKILPKQELAAWIDGLIASYRVIGPRRKQDHFVFAEIRSAAEVELDYPTSALPPKKALLPERESLLRFKINEDYGVEPVLDYQPTVILGIHTCDLWAIEELDHVFGQGFNDQHYQARRQNVTLVSLECLKPCSEHAFCRDMGTLVAPDRFDLHLTDLGDAYALELGSAKGAALLNGTGIGRAADERDYDRLNRVIGSKWARFPYRLEADVTELPSLMQLGARSSLWTEVGERCLGCGGCTIVCPTCTCFDVQDEVAFDLQTGQRLRVWDSCQYDEFATVAGGHDFRSGRVLRQRHRFSHKYQRPTGMALPVSCVGCGRCAQTCLVDITPVDVLNRLYQQVVVAGEQQREVVR